MTELVSEENRKARPESVAPAPDTDRPPRARPDAAPRLWRRALGRYAGVVIGLVVVCLYLAIAEPKFMTGENWSNIVRSQSVVFVLAIGATIVILTGGIDLSIASVTTAALMCMGLTIEYGGSAFVAILVCVGAGTVMGLINGLLIGVGRLPFFVVTLGTLSIYASFALLTTNGQTITLFTHPSFNPVSKLANGSLGPVPTVLVLLLALYAAAGFVLHMTRTGRSVYAFGSNPEAARITGINTVGIQVLVYAAAGLFGGVGAVLLGGRLTAAGPQVDPTLMLTVIAAVLIGGTAFTGGEGGLLGTIVGVLFLGVVQNGLSLANVSTFWQGAVSGTILITAVAVGLIRRGGLGGARRRARSAEPAGAPPPAEHADEPR